MPSDPIEIPDSELSFAYARSSGPGGQNVNKVETKVTLRWEVLESPSISDDVRERFVETYATRITNDGIFHLSRQRHRTRKANQEACVDALHEMLEEVRVPPKKRKKRKVSKGQKRMRLEAKRRRSEKKSARRRPELD